MKIVKIPRYLLCGGPATGGMYLQHSGKVRLTEADDRSLAEAVFCAHDGACAEWRARHSQEKTDLKRWARRAHKTAWGL